MPTILEISKEYRSRLFSLDDSVAKDIVQRYRNAYLDIERRAEALLDQIRKLRANGEAVNLAKLHRLERFQRLGNDIEAQFERFGTNVATVVERAQSEALTMGNQAATKMGRAGIKNSVLVGGSWNRVPVESLESLVGFFQDGSPLKDFFDTFGRFASQEGQSVLEKAVITGQNPRQTKKQLGDALGTTGSQSLTIARTEQLRAYREAGTANYQANDDVVESVTRIEELDELTCIVCIDECGQSRPVTESFEPHPNCRGTDVPNVRGDDTKAPDGKEWFDKLSPEEQETTLGPKRYELWKDGQVELSDFNKRTVDERWGAMRTVGSIEYAKEQASKRQS